MSESGRWTVLAKAPGVDRWVVRPDWEQKRFAHILDGERMALSAPLPVGGIEAMGGPWERCERRRLTDADMDGVRLDQPDERYEAYLERKRACGDMVVDIFG